MVSTVPGTTPLVFDSPHSGTHYPADFRSACSLPTLRRAEDTHVEKIYAFAPALGVAWVEAHFPRTCFFLAWHDNWGLGRNRHTRDLLGHAAIVNRDDLPRGLGTR